MTLTQRTITRRMSRGVTYNARRIRLLEVLRAAGPRGTTTTALRGQLGWASREVTAKLRSLRTDGHATYNPSTERWTATKDTP